MITQTRKIVKDLKIIFFGTPDFAIPALEALIREDYNITDIFTQPDKPTGRKQTLSPPPVKLRAESLKPVKPSGPRAFTGLKVFQPKTLKDDDAFESFTKLNPDICIVAAYGKIIPKRYLGIPKYGFVNVHPSLLPKYRGPSPIQTAILNGEKETGVTIIIVDEEIDHGGIVSSIKYQVSRYKNYKEIEDDLAKLGAKLLIETLPKYVDGNFQLKSQDHSQATFTKMLSREDGRINWSEPAVKIYNKIRALNPEPGAWTTWNGKILNIKKAGLQDEKINIQTIQIEGKKEMAFQEFLNGHPNFDISQLN
jgi:methionyl-tRNA formyltransferase